MARKIVLSLATFLVAFCLGLSLIAFAGAALIVSEHLAVPTQVNPVE